MTSPKLCAVFLLCASAIFAANRDFILPLHLTNSHLGQLFLGCQRGATDGFDREFDDLAPPPGIQTGYAGFISTLPNTLLYKDIKAHGDLKEWRLSLQVYEGKPLRISWRPEQLPTFYHLVLVTGEGEVDMAEVNQVEFTASQVVAIVATLDLAAVAVAESATAAPPQEDETKPAEAEEAPSEAEAKPSPEARPAPRPPPAAAEPPSAERVAYGVKTLILAMGGLLLLVVIFAAVRRQ